MLPVNLGIFSSFHSAWCFSICFCYSAFDQQIYIAAITSSSYSFHHNKNCMDFQHRYYPVATKFRLPHILESYQKLHSINNFFFVVSVLYDYD